VARYDRIARLDCPPRDQAFPAWMALRDLKGREREPDLGRRARLRFLALRPALRLLRHDDDQLEPGSFQQQLDGVSNELAELPSRDPERSALSAYLRDLGTGDPADIVVGALAVGGAVEAAGQPFAAGEFFRTALELAERFDRVDLEQQALRRLGRLFGDRQCWAEAADVLEDAARRAQGTGHGPDWARARVLLAAVRARQGDTAGARRVLDEVLDRAVADGSDFVRGIAGAGRCRVELTAGDPDAALDAGADALDKLPGSSDERVDVLMDMAAAFRRLGLPAAAETCYAGVVRSSGDPERRAEALVELVLVAVEAADAGAFHERRGRLADSTERTDPRTAALVELGLGRACHRFGDRPAAREHLAAAMTKARAAGQEPVLDAATALLHDIEGERTVRPAPELRTPAASSRRIAERVKELNRALAPAG